MARQVISHRSKAFSELISKARENSGTVLRSKLKPVILTCSGTGGLEASAVNFIHPDDHVLVLSSGYYGDLFGRIIRSYQKNTDLLTFAPGTCIQCDRVEECIRAKQYDVIALTHTESSTGVINPLESLMTIIRRYSGALVMVDAISSVGTTEVRFDDWEIDVLISAPQKGLMAPPGLSLLFVSNRARKRISASSATQHCFNLAMAITYNDEGTTPFTPAVNLIYGLDAALERLLHEGLPQAFRRHQRIANICQQTLVDAGITLFAQENCRAPGITAICLPNGITSDVIQRDLEEQYSILVTQGLDTWKSSTLRIGHMGWFEEADVVDAARVIASFDWSRYKHEVGGSMHNAY